MNVAPLAILSLIAYVFPPVIWSRIWRARLLKNETEQWAKACRVANRKSCEDFVGCCKKFPDMARCTESGGILEYPTCNYWEGEQFDAEKYGACYCFEKFILADYKSKCEDEDDKTKCLAFLGCCVGADKGRCDHFVGGELEHPACHSLMGKTFNYNQAVCQCAIDSPNATLRENKTSPTFPDITMPKRPTIPTKPTESTAPTSPASTAPPTGPTSSASTSQTFPATSTPPLPTPTTPPPPHGKVDSDSGGEKNSGSCVWMVTLAMLTAVMFHRYQRPMLCW